MSRVESSLTSLHRPKKRAYSPRNRLRREMVRGHPVLELFVSGSSTGSDKSFLCTICHRDVSMETRGAGELTRHFSGDRHWQADVTYRVNQGLPVFNKLKDPLSCRRPRKLISCRALLKTSWRGSLSPRIFCLRVLGWTQVSRFQPW